MNRQSIFTSFGASSVRLHDGRQEHERQEPEAWIERAGPE